MDLPDEIKANTRQLTAADLRMVREALTWGDQFQARKDAKDDLQEISARAMWRAARRIQMVPPDMTLEEFLDDVPVDVMSEVLAETRDPTSADTAT